MTTVFDIADVVRIIETCGRSGVAKFSYGGLELSFLQSDRAPNTEPLFVPPEVRVQQDSQAREALTQEEVSLRQSQLDAMLVDDPEAYENALRQRDIE